MAHAQAGIADFQENMEALKQNFLLRGYFKKRGYEDSADLAKDAILHLPEGSPLKTFTYEPKRLFDKIDTAKLKNEGSLGTAGKFLARQRVRRRGCGRLCGATGDAQKDLVLTQARAAVVRAYLVGNFGFDDTQLKTLGMGKKIVRRKCECRLRLGRRRDRYLSGWHGRPSDQPPPSNKELGSKMVHAIASGNRPEQMGIIPGTSGRFFR